MSELHNPYIGPRTFQEDERDRFFGREREAGELLALTLSERLVLFYAQSGAGKSSLVNTCLSPDLRENGFEVFRGRVAGDAPPELTVKNIYGFNLIRNLAPDEMSLSSVNELTLSQYFAQRRHAMAPVAASADEDEVQPHALIIDQFEEIFSAHQEEWKKRKAFFEQLSQAMTDDPYLWVVLVMREDFIAALDPYAGLLPGGLRRRYYMQRLEREAAIKAVRIPAEKFHRPYEPDVAEKLVEDLSRVKVQRPDGTLGFEPGQFIEPVQLQVVCYGLWENLRPGSSITEKDLLEVGDVDEALGKYFAGRIAGVAQAKGVKERLIREWIEKKLIAPSGIRSMVMQETNKKSGEISDDVIQALQSDLVRAENRGGAVWYELTHDRLVGPILANNKEWFEKNLSALQRQATLWNDKERDKSWLLRDHALEEVQTWADKNPDEVGELEKKFLEACHEQQREIEQEQEVVAARRQRRFTVVVTTLGLLAMIAAVLAFIKGQQSNASAEVARLAQATAQSGAMTAQALRDVAVTNFNVASTAQADAVVQANRALSGDLVAQADSLKNANYKLALLFGIEAYARDPKNLLTRTTLFHLLQFTPYTRKTGFTGPVSSVAVSPDGKWIATGSCTTGNTGRCTNGSIKLFNADMQEIQDLSKSYADFGIIYDLAFYQYSDRLVLAAGGCVPDIPGVRGCAANKGQITFWDVSDPQNPALLSDTKEIRMPGLTHTGLVKTIAFSPNGESLASGSYDTTIVLWKLTDLKKPAPIRRFQGRQGHSSFVNSVVFSLDGNTIVSASDDTTIRFWNLQHPEAEPKVYENQNNAPFNSIAFSPDGKKFAAAGDDNIVLLWGWDAAQTLSAEPVPLEGHTGYVKSVAFNRDGMLLASTGFDNEIILWDTAKGEQIGSPLNVHSGAVNSISFGIKNLDGNESPYLVSASNDRTIIQWDLSARQPVSYTMKSPGDVPSEPVIEAQDSSGALQANATGQQIDVKYSGTDQTFLTLDGFDSPVQYVQFDGQQLMTMDETQRKTNRITRWHIQDSDWLSLACEAVKRNLTPTIWKEFIDYLNGRPPVETCVTGP